MSPLEFTLVLALAILCIVSSTICFGMLASEATSAWLPSVRMMIWIISGVCLLQTMPVLQLLHDAKPLSSSDLYFIITMLIGRVCGTILCSSVVLNFWRESSCPKVAMARDFRLSSKRAPV